jgi:hypothetical protein
VKSGPAWFDTAPPDTAGQIIANVSDAASAALQVRDSVDLAGKRVAAVECQLGQLITMQAEATRRHERAMLHVRIILFGILLLLLAK